MRASIIIVTYGQRELTEQCLRSLDRCLGRRLGTEWELVLVDNASTDDTPNLLRSWSSRAVVRLLKENRDFAGGCNLGASAASGEVLVFLNNDTEVTPGALDTIAAQALEPGVSVAGCRLLFPQGTLQHAGVAFFDTSQIGGATLGEHFFYLQDQEFAPAKACYELDCVTGACIAVRATTFRAVDGFDECYRNGLEDVDLCLRIRMTGERVIYRGDATVVHHEGASRGKGRELTATPARTEALRHNLERFIRAWDTRLAQDDELAARLWDARLENLSPTRLATTADSVVLGQPSGIGPAADEARALLGALVACGYITAGIDVPRPTVMPRLSGEIAVMSDQARRRYPVPGALWIFVPTGAHDSAQLDAASVVRVARPDTAVRLDEVAAVWASCPAVAKALIDGGASARRVAVVPPPVLTVAPGLGGHGVVAVLPTHDPHQARAVLDALHRLPTSVPVRLVPTVGSWHLQQDVAEILPRAELLGPCSDEARFAEMASNADVVVAVDASDRFERRALVAAGVGAAPITANPAGPTAALLGDSAVANVAALASRLDELVADPGDRLERSARIAQACSPEAFAVHLPTGVAAPAGA